VHLLTHVKPRLASTLHDWLISNWKDRALEKLSTTMMGLVTGAMMGGLHLLWSLSVAAGWGQSILDFFFWMYFIKPIDLIEPFEPARAFTLVAISSTIGFVLGSVAARVWNRIRAQMLGIYERPVHRVTRVL
jgi:hypothetical protein